MLQTGQDRLKLDIGEKVSGMIHRIRLALALVPLLTSCLLAEPLTLKVGLDTKNLYLALKNRSKEPVAVYNQWTDYDKFMPGNVKVTLLKEPEHVVIDSDNGGNGPWHGWAKKQHLVSEELPGFTDLPAGEQIRLKVPLSFLLERIRPEFLEKATHIKVRCTVFHSNRDFQRFLTNESDWVKLPASAE
jgi:hypothetical protein